MDLYHQLLFEFACTKHSEVIFNEWLENHGYGFRVKNKIFTKFEEMWEYLMNLNNQTNINNGFEIIKMEKFRACTQIV